MWSTEHFPEMNQMTSVVTKLANYLPPCEFCEAHVSHCTQGQNCKLRHQLQKIDFPETFFVFSTRGLHFLSLCVAHFQIPDVAFSVCSLDFHHRRSKLSFYSKTLQTWKRCDLKIIQLYRCKTPKLTLWNRCQAFLNPWNQNEIKPWLRLSSEHPVSCPLSNLEQNGPKPVITGCSFWQEDIWCASQQRGQGP